MSNAATADAPLASARDPRVRRPPAGFVWASNHAAPFHLTRIPRAGEITAGDPVRVLCDHPLRDRAHLTFPAGALVPTCVATGVPHGEACDRCVDAAERLGL
jgi:hypothetical protein